MMRLFKGLPPARHNVLAIGNDKRYYLHRWNSLFVLRKYSKQVNWYVDKLLDSTSRYINVERSTGVPWEVVGAIHMMESGGDFNMQLLNGQRWDMETTMVPKHRGPWGSWEESCMAAFETPLPKVWDVCNTLGFLESYNGMGYAKMGKPSPYLWSFSNHYESGKYVSDGKYKDNAVSKQCGTAVMLHELRYDGRTYGGD